MTVFKELGDFQKNVHINKFEKAVGFVGKLSGWESQGLDSNPSSEAPNWAAVGKPIHDFVPYGLYL